jgi:hypothetical protein
MAKNKQDIDFNIRDYLYAYITLGDKTIKVDVGKMSYYAGEGMFEIINYKSAYLVHASNVTFEK